MQNILVFLFITAALIYLGRQFFLRFIKKESHCEQCAFSNMDKKRSSDKH